MLIQRYLKAKLVRIRLRKAKIGFEYIPEPVRIQIRLAKIEKAKEVILKKLVLPKIAKIREKIASRKIIKEELKITQSKVKIFIEESFVEYDVLK
jgi:hypothetical protein